MFSQCSVSAYCFMCVLLCFMCVSQCFRPFSFCTMPLVKCIYVSGDRGCRYEFGGGGHSTCVAHRQCVSVDFVFDPLMCVACKENVKYWGAVGVVAKMSPLSNSLRRSWDAVRRSAKRTTAVAYWADPSLQAFVLGKPSRTPARPGPSFASPRSSPSISVTVSAPGHSSASDISLPGPSPASATAPAPVASLPLTPVVQSFLLRLVEAARPPPSVSSTSPVRLAAPPTVPANASPSVSPIGSPVAPPPDDDLSAAASSAPLPVEWLPVPSSWRVDEDASPACLFRPDPVLLDSWLSVPGAVVRWGRSGVAVEPSWHILPADLPPPHSVR